MKTEFIEIARDGISYAKRQIEKLEAEIENMRKVKKGASSVILKSINEIIKWDRKLISDFRSEIAFLKRRL